MDWSTQHSSALLQCTKLEQTKERAVAHEIEKHKVAIFRLQQQSMGVQAQLMQLKQTQEQFQHDVLKLGTSTRLSNANSQITEKQGQDKVLKLHEQKYLHDLREMNQKIQKKKTEIGVLHRHYIADKTAHGCDWKKCPLDECRQCPYGFKLESVAEIEPETAMCKCGCKCKHVAAQADEGMNWVDIDRVVAGSGRCAVKEESQIAMCQTGRKVRNVFAWSGQLILPQQVVGCLAGVQVELFCGCDAAYKWSFGRSQEVSIVSCISPTLTQLLIAGACSIAVPNPRSIVAHIAIHSVYCFLVPSLPGRSRSSARALQPWCSELTNEGTVSCRNCSSHAKWKWHKYAKREQCHGCKSSLLENTGRHLWEVGGTQKFGGNVCSA